MNNCDLSKILLNKIMKSCIVTSDTYSTTQNYSNDGTLISMGMVALSIINFANKTAYMNSSNLNPNVDFVTSIKYINNNKYTMEYSAMPDKNSQQSTSVINYSECSYNQLFKPCGELFPINLEGVIPIANPDNSKTFQAYTFDEKRACTIVGYVDSLITINWKCENYFEVNMDIKVKDSMDRVIENVISVTIDIEMCNNEEQDCQCN